MSHSDHPSMEPSYSKNRKILRWWTPAHDKLLRDLILKDQWIWYWSVSDRICEITPPETIDKWKVSDPVCRKYAWYNVLMYFAIARAKDLHLDRLIRKPQSRRCAACGRSFMEDSIPSSVARYLRVDQIDVCLACINAYFGVGADPGRRRSKDQILNWIVQLCDELHMVPPQSILGSLDTLTPMFTEERVKLLRLAQGKPMLHDIKNKFGSWLNALVQAGVLEGGVRETARGTHCIARDGHVCYSYGEKTIDDFLFTRGIVHEKEPHYPGANYRADFKVGEVFIEYFGLAGDEDYDSRTKEKKRIARLANIELIGLSPKDLLSETRLSKKLERVFRQRDI